MSDDDKLEYRCSYTTKAGQTFQVWSDSSEPELEYFDHALLLTPEPIDINRWLWNRKNSRRPGEVTPRRKVRQERANHEPVDDWRLE